MTTTKQTVHQAAASVVACSSSSDTIDSIDCALNSDDSDDSLLAAVIRSNNSNKQQQQSQIPRSVKRSTSVASPNNSSATDLTTTNVAMNQSDNVVNSPNVANLKHQPKKMKKKVVEHSVLRRTFSMTDEEFEDYEDDEEDEGIATNVAKCSLGDDDEEEDKDSVVETTTSEDEEEYEEVPECRNHKCINCCHEDVQLSKADNSACAPMCQSYQSLHSEDDNTSDLTSSPPPPDVTSSSPSCYSSPTISPSSSSLNPDFQTLLMTNLAPKGSDNNNNTTSASPPPPPPLPESSNHHHYSESFTNDVTTTTTATSTSDNNNNGSNALYEKCQSTESGCCPLCCPDPEVRIGSDSPGSCTSLPQSPQSSVIPEMSCSKPHLLPYYPPTVSSIRDAVSHLTRLDDFNVVKLSHGFFSQVFKVIHFSTKKVMVLKMNKEAGNRGNALKEIELLNKLNHENIVAYMGTVVHEGALHPLLEFINGGTLEQLIRPFYCLENSEDISLSSSLTSSMNVPSPYQSRLSSSVCLSPKVHRLREPDWTFVKLMRDVARGMDYLHSNGYLHRDLASKNVFIRKLTTNCDTQQPPVRVKGQGSLDYQESVDEWWYDDDRLSAVIGDFGFATTEPMTPDQKLSTVGSPYWMAPECFKALWYNHKCDIYSFGVICCELNWRIPADPDYLPRCDDNFVVDFGKLYTKKDTTLGRVARMTCQTNPTARPEFSALLELLDIEMNKHENSVKNNVAKQVATINGSLDTSQMVDLNDTFDASSCNSSASASPFTFKRGYSLDSTLIQCNNSTAKKQQQQQQEPPKSPTKSSFNESDIFEQHLLRRRYSSALAAANGHKSIISPCSHNRTSSSTVSNCSKIASNNCTHAHYLPHLYHNHNHHHQQQQRPLVYRNFSNPLPDIRHNSET